MNIYFQNCLIKPSNCRHNIPRYRGIILVSKIVKRILIRNLEKEFYMEILVILLDKKDKIIIKGKS